MNPERERALLRQVQEDLDSCRELGLTFREDPVHTRLWNLKFREGTQRLIDDGGRIDPTALADFRRQAGFIGDGPSIELNHFSPGNLLLGSRRGQKALLKKCLRVLEEHGLVELLRKHPSPAIGNPYLIEHRGLRYSHRWFRHIYALGRMNSILRPRLKTGFIALDIGSGYGIFQGLLYREYPGCHQVLVDLPEMLLLARYFLAVWFPEARIAGMAELSGRSSITRDFIEEHDFLLLPSSWYGRLEARSANLVTSFACLGELKREFFDYYVQAPVFKTADYLFTINPITAESFWCEDSDVTILDYPIWEPQKKLYFGLCPAYFHSYRPPKQKLIVFYKFRRFPPFFEYMGMLCGERPA